MGLMNVNQRACLSNDDAVVVAFPDLWLSSFSARTTVRRTHDSAMRGVDAFPSMYVKDV